MNLYELVARLRDEGTLDALINDPLAQFGQQGQFLGATLLPERMVASNSYEETEIRFRSVVANSGARHAPAQIRRGGRLTGTFSVQTGSSDIASVFDSNDHDAIVDLLQRQQDFEAAGFLSNWVTTTVTEPLRVLVEKERWQAIVDAEVIRTGDNGYYREIVYPNPAGHRFAAGGSWSSDSYDPFEDLFAGAQLLQDKGYTLGRIIARSTTSRLLSRNPLVQQRVGNVRVVGDATFQGFGATREQINGYLGAEGLPGIEIYDERYFTEEASHPFLTDGSLVMLATTDLDETVVGPADIGDTYLPNTLGYTAIGRPSGEDTPGRATVIDVSDRKPRTITAEGWQEMLPVVTRPEAIVVISGIA